MQNLRIYLVIENPETRDLVNINGSFEVFRELLNLWPELPQTEPLVATLPAQAQETKQGGMNVTG